MKKHFSLILLACAAVAIVSCSQTISPETPASISDSRVAATYQNAVNGDIAALKTIARYYKSGLHGLPESPRQSINCYKTAADLGDVYSQRMTGAAYMEGYGRLQSDSNARKYLGMAADQGDQQAAALLDELEKRIAQREAEAAAKRAERKRRKAAQDAAIIDMFFGPKVYVVE